MPNYRKKALEITAEQVDEETKVETPRGTVVAFPGDFLVTGVEGEKYPVTPMIFAKTYEPTDRESAEEFAPEGVEFEFGNEGIESVYVVEDECSSELERGVAAEFVRGFIETHPDLILSPTGDEFKWPGWDDDGDDEGGGTTEDTGTTPGVER